MKREHRQYFFIALLFGMVVISGVNYFHKPFQKKPIKTIETIKEVITEGKIDTFIEVSDRLTPTEKVSQMISFPIYINDQDELVSIDNYSQVIGKSNFKPGFITIFGSNISSESAKRQIGYLNDQSLQEDIPLRFLVDHEGGSVQRLNGEGYTQLPSWNKICQLETQDRVNLLKKSALELKETGINIILAPVLDVGDSHALNDRICSDSYPVVADRSVDFTSAFASNGILPVLKHFPGIGTVNRDLHYLFSSVSVDVNDVKLYKYVVEQSPIVGAMIAHIGVENQDPELPCSLSKACVGELKNAYPNMLFFSDALDMESASYNKENPNKPKNLIDVSIQAVEAGEEILVYGQGVSAEEFDEIISSLTSEYNSNQEFKSLVDKAVLKIVEYKWSQL